jgi:hypothetical protein
MGKSLDLRYRIILILVDSAEGYSSKDRREGLWRLRCGRNGKEIQEKGAKEIKVQKRYRKGRKRVKN